MGEIRYVGTGETRGYPYLVCKENKYLSWVYGVDRKIWYEGH